MKAFWLKIRRWWVSKRRRPTRSTTQDNNSNTTVNNSSRGEPNFAIRIPNSIYLPELDELPGSYKWDPKGKYALACGHVTAGWSNQTPKDFFEYMRKKGYFTDFIPEEGGIYQQGDGDVTGPNVGKSSFVYPNGKKKYNLNSYTRGIEMACGGRLWLWIDGKKKYWTKREIPSGGVLKTWFGKEVSPKRRRYVTTSEGYEHTGWFETLTSAQEKDYANWLNAMVELGVPKEHLVEHAKLAPDRRSDIGGCLSMPHHKFVEKYVN